MMSSHFRIVGVSILVVWLASIQLVAVAAGLQSGNDAVLDWNDVALQVSRDDTSGLYGPPAQPGPTRMSRALAIVHIAIFDAVNAIDRTHEPYVPVVVDPATAAQASMQAAVAQAAHDTLAALFPGQQAKLASQLKKDLKSVPSHHGRDEGVLIGRQAAANILAVRSGDGSAMGNAFIYPPSSGLPGEHMPDPINPGQGLLTPGWGSVETFSGLDPADAAIRAVTPPALVDSAYTNAWLDVYWLGGDGLTTPTIRTTEQTDIGVFWAYDGAYGIGVPPRLYNQVVRVLAKQQKYKLVQNARLFALANIAMADAGIACWDSKYYYNVWRPVVAIRRAGEDGNPNTANDAAWTPLGAPSSNSTASNFTPPFPAYPSGHAAFGAATFAMLRNFHGADELSFSLKSDEMSGQTTNNNGKHRRTVIRRFDRFSDAAEENGRSRVYLGIHWQFDADAGIVQGNAVADFVFNNLLRPIP